MLDKLDPGLYELPLTRALRELVARLGERQLSYLSQPLDAESGPPLLARLMHDLLARALRNIEGNDASAQIELINRVIDLVRESASTSGVESEDALVTPAEVLLAVVESGPTGLADPTPLARPGIPLRSSDLLVNGPRDLSVGPEIRNELASADRADLLCSFLKWSGLRVVRDSLVEFLRRRPGGLRVLTTVYMGATDRRALDELVRMGAKVRVSYDTARTRLHAKAWLFTRDSGFSTAFIGSSNLSAAALVDGLEWNVRLSAIENPAILSKFRVTFDQYWDDGEFVEYDPERDGERFERAARREVGGDVIQISGLEVQPRPFQREILEGLEAERQRGHTRNLVVAATGTGKTVMAALDYKRERRKAGDLSLLFVAHRKEILDQSVRVFREVLQDGSFGERLYEGTAPVEGRHVFASIQSLHADRLARVSPEAFNYIVVDEFHHAAAPSYEKLLAHLRPRILLGLTATPERTDRLDVLHYFDGRIASELRLWSALDQGLLCPFQYFGVSDATDLSHVEWKRGYVPSQLESLYTADDARVRLILRELNDKVADLSRMRALGFCVSIDHAEFMARRFVEAGIPAKAVSTRTRDDDRAAALRDLRDRSIRILFAVDLFNEGIDVPDIDMVLFLRPTESATVFLQQLGRGLRRAEGKECLTVLDFIGNAHKRFRFDLRFRALVGGTRHNVKEHIERGFPKLPAGCAIRLDREAQETVLRNVRQALQQGWGALVDDLQALGHDVTLGEFLRETGAELDDVYSSLDRSWTGLKRAAGRSVPSAQEGEGKLTRAISRMIHVTDPVRVSAFRKWLAADKPPSVAVEGTAEHRLQLMLLALFGRTGEPVAALADTLADIWRYRAVREEICELFDVLNDESRTSYEPIGIDQLAHLPLLIHAEYSRDEIMAAFGVTRNGRHYQPREGVYHDVDHRTDILMVTLNKTEREYSPSTMYNDYPISPTLFHWESQSTVRPSHAAGQRYVTHQTTGSNILLFARLERRSAPNRTMPYTFLGPVQYVSHQGERPMQVVWRLEHEMPARFFQETKVAAG